MIGASFGNAFLDVLIAVMVFVGFVTRALRLANAASQTQQAVSATAEESQAENARWVLRCAAWAHYHLHAVDGLG